jgi:DNA-binding transcriptional LysR family regulator
MRTLVAETVGALRREAPDLAVQLLEAVDGELLDALVGRQVDLVVASCPLAHPEIEQLGACAHGDRFAVFCAADHPLPDDSTLQQVLAADWVMPGRALTPRATFESLVDALGVHRPRIAVETSSVEAMVAVASRSNLLCWLPEPLVAAQIANGVIRRLVVPELTVERRFVLHCRRSGLLPDAARLFVRHFPFEAAGA